MGYAVFMGLMLLALAALVGAIAFAMSFFASRRSDARAEDLFPDDEEARTTYALLRHMEGLGGWHLISNAYSRRRLRRGRQDLP
jgi:hypothetical protein